MQDNYLGKLPPQAIELEEAILGALMLEKAYYRIADIVSHQDFYKDRNQIIFKAISDLENMHFPVDILTVTAHLKKTGTIDDVGGAYYVSSLTNRVASSANIEHYAHIVKEKSIARILISIAHHMIEKAHEDSVDIINLCDEAEGLISKATKITLSDISIRTRIKDAIEAIHKAMNTETGISGLSSGYSTIDSGTGGWQDGDLIVLGGAPGTFKTALVINFLHNAAKIGVPVALFEQEMNKKQVGIREIAINTGLDVNRLTRGRVSNEEIKYMQSQIDNIISRPVYIDDVGGLTINSFRSKLKKMIDQHGIKLCAIDYLQLMDMGISKHKGNMVQAIDETVKEIKLIARSFNIPIILLSQMGRESNKDWKNPPTIFDLKGSGGIEANADLVLLSWNPNKHSLEQTGSVFIYGDTDTSNKLGIIFAKQRQGDTGISWLNCFAGSNTFGDMNNVSAQKSISAENDVF